MKGVVIDVQPANTVNGNLSHVYIKTDKQVEKASRTIDRLFISKAGPYSSIEGLKDAILSKLKKDGIQSPGLEKRFEIKKKIGAEYVLHIKAARDLAKYLPKGQFKSPTLRQSLELEVPLYSKAEQVNGRWQILDEKATLDDLVLKTGCFDLEVDKWEEGADKETICSAALATSDGNSYTFSRWSIKPHIPGKVVYLGNQLEIALGLAYFFRREKVDIIAGHNIEKYDLEKLKYSRGWHDSDIQGIVDFWVDLCEPFYMSDRWEEYAGKEEKMFKTVLRQLKKGEIPQEAYSWGGKTKKDVVEKIKTDEIPREVKKALMKAHPKRFKDKYAGLLKSIIKDGVFAIGPEFKEPVFKSSSFLRKQHIPGMMILDTLPYAQLNLDLTNNKLATVANYYGISFEKSMTHGEITPEAAEADKGDGRAAGRIMAYNLEDTVKSLELANKVLDTALNLSMVYETSLATVCSTAVQGIQEDLFKKQIFGERNYWHNFKEIKQDIMEDKVTATMGLNFRTWKGNYQDLYVVYPTHVFRSLEKELKSNPAGKELLELFENETDVRNKIVYAQHLDNMCSKILYSPNEVRDIFDLNSLMESEVRWSGVELKKALDKEKIGIVNATNFLFLKGRPGLEQYLEENPYLELVGKASKVLSAEKGRVIAQIGDWLYGRKVTLDEKSKKGSLCKLERSVKSGILTAYLEMDDPEEFVRYVEDQFKGLGKKELDYYIYEDRTTKKLEDFSARARNTERYSRLKQANASPYQEIESVYVRNKGYRLVEHLQKEDEIDDVFYRNRVIDGMDVWLNAVFVDPSGTEKQNKPVKRALKHLRYGLSQDDRDTLAKAYAKLLPKQKGYQTGLFDF